MDGDDLEPAMNSRSTGVGREPDAIRHGHDDERCPIACVGRSASAQTASTLALTADTERTVEDEAPRIHYRRDAQPVPHTADDLGWFGEMDRRIQ